MRWPKPQKRNEHGAEPAQTQNENGDHCKEQQTTDKTVEIDDGFQKIHVIK